MMHKVLTFITWSVVKGVYEKRRKQKVMRNIQEKHRTILGICIRGINLRFSAKGSLPESDN